MQQATPKQNFEPQFSKKLSNTETGLKKSIAQKKRSASAFF